MSQQSIWGATVGTAIALQWSVVLALAGIAGLVSGKIAGVSLLFGGAAVAFPNTVLAAWLTLRVLKTGNAGAATMMFGEILKIALTVSLLVMVVVKLRPDVSWLALMVGVIGALKAQWLALWVTRRSA
jgi:ATP synthase protein I